MYSCTLGISRPILDDRWLLVPVCAEAGWMRAVLVLRQSRARVRRPISFPLQPQTTSGIEGVLLLNETQAEEREVLVVVACRSANQAGLRLHFRTDSRHLLVANLIII